jgi:hypothetical protein
MGSWANLMVGKVELRWYKSVVPPEILALFHDENLEATPLHPHSASIEDYERFVRLTSSVGKVRQRLAIFGFTESKARQQLGEVLQEDADIESSLDPSAPGCTDMASVRAADVSVDSWVAAFRDPSLTIEERIKSRTAANAGEILYDLGSRTSLVACLLGLPDEAPLVLDLTELYYGGWLPEDLSSIASDALTEVQRITTTDAPLIVLTEGKTDAQLLGLALEVLHPHLVDLVRFMDFTQKPEGGASALVRTVRAFAAAGVANRVLALFDNDSAAWDARRALNSVSLPPNILAACYPGVDLAARYPTVAEPAMESKVASTQLEDVNGRAGSLELYLGRAALTDANGQLRPVVWSSYLRGVQREQGEVLGKKHIQQAYRSNAKAVLSGQMAFDPAEWQEMKAILDLVLHAFDGA